MKKVLLALLFILLFLNAYIKSEDDCTRRFNSYLKNSCESHSINITHSCSYSNGQCKFKFNTCSSYSGSDKTTCESIFPSGSLQYCKVINRKCTLFNKNCDEYDPEGKYTCSEYTAGESQSCRLINNKCQAHFDKCEDFTSGVNEEKCKANIPLISTNKCIWDSDNNSCKEVEKKCNDYSSTSYSKCETLSTTDENKICVASSEGVGCVEQYKTCELYNEKETSKNKEGCEAIITYSNLYKKFDTTKKCSFSGTTCTTENKNCEDIKDQNECEGFVPSDYQTVCVYDGSKCKKQYKHCLTYNTRVNVIYKNKEDCEAIRYYRDFDGFDSSYKCVFEEGTCSLVKKECKEFNTSSTCKSHRPENYAKICVFSEDKCIEQYKLCEDYDKEISKTKEACENIKPYYSEYSDSEDIGSRCVFNGTNCIKKKKNCSEMTNKYQCSEHTLDDTNKKCIYYDDECKEVYKSCSAYNNDPNKNEEGCRAIDIYYTYNSQSYIDYNYKCIFKDNTCKQKKLSHCDDYESWMGEEQCKRISINNNYQDCVFKDNKCQLVYTDCPRYNKDVSEEVCNSITPSIEYLKCVYDEDNKCVSELRHCSEYIDDDPIDLICSLYYRASNENKTCGVENKKCIEKWAKCEAYTGNDKVTCEGIIPNDEYKYKCVMENNKCLQKEKECKEARSSLECNKIKPVNTKKECIYNNGQCKEQYKDCDYYSNNGEEEVVKTICESIILSDDDYKCTFDISSKKCLKEKKSCEDFNTNDNYEKICISLSSSYYNSKCIYTNSVCSLVNRTCFELEGSLYANEEFCLTAETSDPKNKVCKFQGAGNGCFEVDKNSAQDNINNGSGNNGNNGNNGSNGKKNNGEFISKFKFGLLFIILWL